MALKIISHAISDIGKVRASNQDSGYSGTQVFFVADGMGGHAGGDIASALTTQRVSQVDVGFTDIEQAREQMVEAMLEANHILGSTVRDHTELSGMGTTLSGLAFVGDQVVVAHIGDSRVYLLRDGQVSQVTVDHTFVQRLVDLGRITPEEALVHPRRSVLMRVLGDVEEQPEIDTEILTTKPGDRWLLCSDGLCGVVPDSLTAQIMKSPIGAGEACELLVGEALEFGAPDNVTVVVLDVVTATAAAGYVPEVKFVGSAANEVVIDDRRGNKLLRLFNPKLLPDLLGHTQDPAAFRPESDEYLEYILSQTRTKIRNHRIRQGALFVLIICALVATLAAGYAYTQSRFYVGSYNGSVAIYQGIRENLGPLSFSHLYEVSDVAVTPLGEFQKQQLIHTIPADNLEDAYRVINSLVELSQHE